MDTQAAAMAIVDRIRRKLDEAVSEQWPERPPIEARLEPELRYDDTAGGLVGGVAFFATSRSKGQVELHREPAAVLRTAEDADDWLARALTNLLRKHPTWPR